MAFTDRVTRDERIDTAAVAGIGDSAPSWAFRSLPPGTSVDELSDLRPNVFAAELPTPTMLLLESALNHNIATMADYCREHGIDIAPHGKTTMAPQLFARQLAAGAWGLSAATPAQVRVYRAFGVQRIMLANQLVDPGATRWLVSELARHPEAEVFCQVDSLAGVDLLDELVAGCETRARLPVLVELGTPGGRAGCRNLAEFAAVARAAADARWLELAGAAGYEGAVSHGSEQHELEPVASYLRSLREAVELLVERDLVDGEREDVVVSAGGSAYFDLTVEALASGWTSERRVRTVLRSGAYISHDSGLYARVSPFARNLSTRWSFRPALQVWGRVLSAPERSLALLDVGRRDVPFDQGLPTPFAYRRRVDDAVASAELRVRDLHDQHCFLELPPDLTLAPGDWVGMGISHPCTAFDKWNLILLVDDDLNVLEGIRTFF